MISLYEAILLNDGGASGGTPQSRGPKAPQVGDNPPQHSPSVLSFHEVQLTIYLGAPRKSISGRSNASECTM